MPLVTLPVLPAYPDNLTTLQNNGYTALEALPPGFTDLGPGQYWYGDYIRLVFGNDTSTYFVNNGTIWDHGSGTIAALGAANIGGETNYGLIVAQSSDGPAYGSGSDSYLGAFYNAGQIYAYSGTTNATAFEDYTATAFVENEGLLAARSDSTQQGTGGAVGIAQYNGGGLLNGATGTILVQGPYATGILVGRGALLTQARDEVVNLGTIHAVSTNAANPSYGLALAGLHVEALRTENDGTVIADIAYQATPEYGDTGANQVFLNAQTGVLQGQVQLLGGNDTIINQGTITGAVSMTTNNQLYASQSLSNDIYFGLFGTQTGAITAGTGHCVIVGSAAADTITAGSGGAEIYGGGGADILNAGSGVDRFVYRALSDSTLAAPDVINNFVSGTDVIDLSALGLSQVNITSANGVTTIAGTGAAAQFAIEVKGTVVASDVVLTGAATQTASASNELLVAPVGGGTLIADPTKDIFGFSQGNSVLLGGPGDDTLVAGPGNTVMDGGGGTNTAVFAGAQSGYCVHQYADGTFTVFAPGSYTHENAFLAHVQKLRFDDRTVDLQGPAYTLSGGGQTLLMTPGQTITLLDTNGVFDTVTGSNGVVNLGNADATINGNNDIVTVDLYQAIVTGSGETVYLSRDGGDVSLNSLGHSTVYALGNDTMSLTGDAWVQIDPGATLTLNTLLFAGQTIVFAPTDQSHGANLVLNAFGGGTLAGLALGDSIDFTNTSVTGAQISGAGLTVTTSAGASASFTSLTSLAGLAPVLASDGNGGTRLSFAPVATTTQTTTYTLVDGGSVLSGAATTNDIFIADAASITRADALTGGSVHNLLRLTGGGKFNIGKIGALTLIDTIEAHEGQAAANGLAATRQTVTLRDGADEMLVVDSASAASGNTNPVGITIYGGTGTYDITLGTGHDAVYLGSGSALITLGKAANQIYGGNGNATIVSNLARASALIRGNGIGTLTLEMNKAGAVTLNAADTNLSVVLRSGSTLALSAQGGVTGDGSAGHCMITAHAAGQTLIGGNGDTLVSAGGDTFAFAAGCGANTITGFATGGPGQDTLAISRSLFADWAHLLGATTQSGSDLLITLDGSDTILLKNVALSAFTSADVRFV